MRAVSNPEGMEKWDSLSTRYEREYFVLPTSIIEEELAEAKAATEAKEQARRKEQEEERQRRLAESEPKGLGISPTSVASCMEVRAQNDVGDESNVTPEELLRRARSRLLEDLSEGCVHGEKGVLTLPHSLSKYKEVSVIMLFLIPFRRDRYSISSMHSPPGVQSQWQNWYLHSR
jgi:hypothetical protein